MCGFAGILSKTPVSPDVLVSMSRQIARRGPDALGTVRLDGDFNPTNGPVFNALTASRLAIMDPRPIANQPMVNETGDVWIAYNGELYGWQGLASTLVSHGITFRTHCDTEVILRAYETWGIEMVNRLRGMFAICILDLRSRELWLVRDRMGQKPVVYGQFGDSFAFGSTVRSILPAMPPEYRRLSPHGVDAYLAHRYVPAPSTVFQRVSRLENGYILRFDLRTRLTKRYRYWTPKPASSALSPILDRIVSEHAIADRPLGVFLSSGIDSTSIAAMLVRGKVDFQAITASFPGSGLDESEDAAATARSLSIRHQIIPMPTSIHNFADIVADLDEPFADPSAVPTWELCRQASASVKVALGGEGLDELLGGYKRLAKHARSAWRESIRLRWLSFPNSIAPKGWSKWISEFAMPWDEAYYLRFSGFTPAQRRCLQPDFASSSVTYWRWPYPRASTCPIGHLIEIDLDNYLPEYILRKTDLCSMAHGLELRAPFLDHQWVEALLALPNEKRFTEPRKKLMEDLVPDIAPFRLVGREKRGFNPPVRSWLHGELRERFDGLGARLTTLTDGLIDARVVERFCSRYLYAARQPSEQLFQLLVLDESLSQLRKVH